MDALLIVSFGGPEGPDDVVPFLANVTRGRGIPRDRLAAVGAHYGHFGGVSPINRLNRELVTRVRGELADRGEDLPVLWGNRNWDPYLADALREARDLGARRIFAFLTSAYSSYSGCRQYRENLHDALEAVRAESPDWTPEIHKLRTYFNHPAFLEPFVRATKEALDRLPAGSRLVFTTHSLPTSDAEQCDYVAQHRDAAATIADEVGRGAAWDLVYQSRSGAPHTPWLEPDIGDHLAALARAGTPGAAVVPIGFVSDHMEVIWDLDTVAAQVARDEGIAMVRVATPGADPQFPQLVVDLLVEQRAALAGGASPARPTLGAMPPRVTPCAAGCCPNPRGPRPALCGAS